MKFLVISDTHLEFHHDDGVEFIEALPNEDNTPDDYGPMGVILAGDICNLRQLPDVLERFSRHYTYVVYLPGNHEAYGFTLDTVHKTCRRLQDELLNVYFLDNNRIQLREGLTFAGGTMWFPDHPENLMLERFLNDFHLIGELREHVYVENEKCVEFLRTQVKPTDIVVTHHLPSPMSVHERYEGSPINCFFLCDVEDVMKERQPKVWIHGHTHDSFDYTIFRTRVICNPFGYPGQPNPNYTELIIDL